MPKTPRRGTFKASALNCPECGRTLDKRDVGPPKQHPLRLPLFVGGAVVSIIWAFFLIKSGLVVVPRGLGGIAVAGAIYLAPGLVMGFFAARLARHRPARCAECEWTGSHTMRS